MPWEMRVESNPQAAPVSAKVKSPRLRKAKFGVWRGGNSNRLLRRPAAAFAF
jgi:hypothetical protein